MTIIIYSETGSDNKEIHKQKKRFIFIGNLYCFCKIDVRHPVSQQEFIGDHCKMIVARYLDILPRKY